MKDEERIIAALIIKLGGDVTITMRDLMDVDDVELTQWYDPSKTCNRYTARPKYAEVIGEIVPDEPKQLGA